MHILNLEQLKAATLAGSVTGITLRGMGAAFVVSVHTQREEGILVTSRKQPRRFADPRKALQLLRTIGLNECRINATDWQPEAHAQEKVSRPDRSAALKAAHEAAQADADYDRWFRAKAQAALDGLKDGSNKPYTSEEWTVRRAQLLERFKTVQAA